MTTYPNTFVATETFEAAEEVRVHVGSKFAPEGIVVSNGTVEAKLYGRTRRLPACLNADGSLWVRGLVGRYQTGAKAWVAAVQVEACGTKVWVNFGRDDRAGRFNKASGLSFA